MVFDHVEAERNDEVRIVDRKIDSIFAAESHRIQTIVSIQIHGPFGHECADDPDSRFLAKPSKLPAGTFPYAAVTGDDDRLFCRTNEVKGAIDDRVVWY